MVRMSDIVRGNAPAPAAEPSTPPTDKDEAKPAASEPPAPPSSARRLNLRDLADTPPPPTAERTMDPAPAPPAVETEKAGPLFQELQRFLDRAREFTRGSAEFPWTDLDRLVERVVTSLDHSAELFWIANDPIATTGVDYLAFHQARVAVLAIRVGANIGLPRRELVDLGVAGCLIDVGLWQAPDGFVRRLDVLSADEQEQYRAHARASAELLRRWGAPRPAIVEVVLQHHEREQGQGFPRGLQHDAIHPHAKILGLVDTYAGTTGGPTVKARLRPHDVIRDLVRSKNESFMPALIKALLAEISVFPPGTPIRLNTGESGHVVGVNRNHPLRPRIEVVSDSKGHALATPRVIDLSETPFLYITGPASEKS